MMNSNVRNGGKEMFKIANLSNLIRKLNYEHLLEAICNTTFPETSDINTRNSKTCFSSNVFVKFGVFFN